MTVKQAIRKAYDNMPEEFHVLALCRSVRDVTGRQYVMDGTITRLLRDLRSEKALDYEIKDKMMGVYKKRNQLTLF